MSDNQQFILLSQSDNAGDLVKHHKACKHVVIENDVLVMRNSSSDEILDHIKFPVSPIFLRPTNRRSVKGWARYAYKLATRRTADDWRAVIDWFCAIAGERPFVVVDFDHPLRELLMIADSRNEIRFGLYFSKEIPRVFTWDYSLIGCSRLCLFENEDIEADFKRKYVGPYFAIHPEDNIQAHITEIMNSPSGLSGETVSAVKSSIRPVGDDVKDDKIRLLIVSYFSGPCRTVGVQRVNYWAEEIERLSEGHIETHLATAINWSSPDVNIHYVPDHNITSMLNEDVAYPSWAPAFAETEARHAKFINTMSYYWRYALERYFDRLDEHFDVVLISGNPFAVFDFGPYAKRRWRASVILDYRDPFANNPRMKYRPEAREHARYVEKGYNLQADLALVVNDRCQDMLEAKDDIASAIIPNGYDERKLKDLTSAAANNGDITLVHAGQFYAYGSPENLLSALVPGKHSFNHIGEVTGIAEEAHQAETFVAHGRQSYPETLRIIGQCDCGVVFLSENNFETTTKIFDYLAAGIDILLVASGEPRQGVLAEMLMDREGVYWSRNTKDDLINFVETYRPTREPQRLRADSERFSRKHSAELLLEQINALYS